LHHLQQQQAAPQAAADDAMAVAVLSAPCSSALLLGHAELLD
jgi:hypothetical protein